MTSNKKIKNDPITKTTIDRYNILKVVVIGLVGLTIVNFVTDFTYRGINDDMWEKQLNINDIQNEVNSLLLELSNNQQEEIDTNKNVNLIMVDVLVSIINVLEELGVTFDGENA